MGKQAPAERHWSRPALSTSHWLHSAFAVAAIGLYILGGMAHTKVSGLPPDFQPDQLSYPVWVGQHIVGCESELIARVAGEPIGYPLLLRSLDGSTNVAVTTQKLYKALWIISTQITGTV